MHRTALPLVLIFLVFFYCSESDDKKNENNNFFSINSERYPINRAGIIDFGPDLSNSIYKGNLLVIIFITEGIEFNQEEDGNLLLEGTGAIMGLVTFSDYKNYLEDGNYFLNLRPPFEKSDVSIAFYSPTFNSEYVVGPYFNYDGISVLSGKMIINHLNKNTVVEMNMIDEIGNTIHTTFEGNLEVLNYNILPKILQ